MCGKRDRKRIAGIESRGDGLGIDEDATEFLAANLVSNVQAIVPIDGGQWGWRPSRINKEGALPRHRGGAGSCRRSLEAKRKF
jgi:hypothetical protein